MSIPINNIQLQQAVPADQAWLYTIYQAALKPYIEQAWGWDDAFQKKGFNNNLSTDHWKIITIDSKKAGGFVLKNQKNDLYLEMLIVIPVYQGSGIGRFAIDYCKKIARDANVTLRLSVIKVNPVKTFYLKQGFTQYEEDDVSYKLCWNPLKNTP